MTKPVGPTARELKLAANKTIPDLLEPSLKILFCGINPGLYSAAISHHFGHPSNRFWKALYEAGLTGRLLSPYEDQEILKLGYGLTNIVSRASVGESELFPKELIEGGRRLKKKLLVYQPAWIAFFGLGAYRLAFGQPQAKVGEQGTMMAETRVWLLPSTSGLNANYQLPQIVAQLKELKQRAD